MDSIVEIFLSALSCSGRNCAKPVQVPLNSSNSAIWFSICGVILMFFISNIRSSAFHVIIRLYTRLYEIVRESPVGSADFCTGGVFCSVWLRGQDLFLRLGRYCSASAERSLAAETRFTRRFARGPHLTSLRSLSSARGFANAKHAPSFQIHFAICHRHIAFDETL